MTPSTCVFISLLAFLSHRHLFLFYLYLFGKYFFLQAYTCVFLPQTWQSITVAKLRKKEYSYSTIFVSVLLRFKMLCQVCGLTHTSLQTVFCKEVWSHFLANGFWQFFLSQCLVRNSSHHLDHVMRIAGSFDFMSGTKPIKSHRKPFSMAEHTQKPSAVPSSALLEPFPFFRLTRHKRSCGH